MICPKCGGANGMVNRTIFQCACAENKLYIPPPEALAPRSCIEYPHDNPVVQALERGHVSWLQGNCHEPSCGCITVHIWREVAPLMPVATNEVVELRHWKQSALRVMPDYQAIAKLLDIKAGDSVHDKIIPAIVAFKEMETAFRSYVDFVGALHTEDCPKDDTCSCPMKPVNDAVNKVLRRP